MENKLRHLIASLLHMRPTALPVIELTARTLHFQEKYNFNRDETYRAAVNLAIDWIREQREYLN